MSPSRCDPSCCAACVSPWPGKSTPCPRPCGAGCLLTGPGRFCSDPDCEGHRCENGVYDPQQDDGDESADEDSCSEHSSSTSTSTNQKEGKYCDCCYCEFFGHGGVSAAPALPGRLGRAPRGGALLSDGCLQTARFSENGKIHNCSARIIPQAEFRVWLYRV